MRTVPCAALSGVKSFRLPRTQLIRRTGSVLPHRITVTTVWHLALTRVPMRHVAAHQESARARPHRGPLILCYKGARRFLVVSLLAFSQLQGSCARCPLLSSHRRSPSSLRPPANLRATASRDLLVNRNCARYLRLRPREAVLLLLSPPRSSSSFDSSPNSDE
jgi:hypothetical protein